MPWASDPARNVSHDEKDHGLGDIEAMLVVADNATVPNRPADAAPDQLATRFFETRVGIRRNGYHRQESDPCLAAGPRHETRPGLTDLLPPDGAIGVPLVFSTLIDERPRAGKALAQALAYATLWPWTAPRGKRRREEIDRRCGCERRSTAWSWGKRRGGAHDTPAVLDERPLAAAPTEFMGRITGARPPG